MDRRKELEARYEEIFGETYDRGLERLKVLMKRSIRFERFAPSVSFEVSKISMNDRDFGRLAFFACMGAGFVEELGIKALPEKASSSVIDAEFEETTKERK